MRKCSSCLGFIITFLILFVLALPSERLEKTKVLAIVDEDTLRVIYEQKKRIHAANELLSKRKVLVRRVIEWGS
jgi:hypothetical protein